MTTAATADPPYCMYQYSGEPAISSPSTGKTRIPHWSRCVNASHTTWVRAPSTADRYQAAARRGRGLARGVPQRVSTAARPRTRRGSSATSGSRSSSHAPTNSQAMATSTVRTPANEWVTSPKTMASGSALAA